MNLLRIIIILVTGSINCIPVQAQDSTNVQAGIVTSRITMLESARQAGPPNTVDPKGKLYETIQSLGRAEVNKQQAANELAEWLFVTEPPPDQFASVTDRSLHPAANALIAIGAAAEQPLKDKLSTATTYKNAVLTVRCLRQIYKAEFNVRLQQLKTEFGNVAVITQAIDYVLREQAEPRGVTLEPEG